jgi:hypothetical protein
VTPDQTEAARRAALRARFPATDFAALRDRPARQWHVPGLLPVGAQVSLVAGAGAGKSNLALDLALHVSQGLPWAGLAPAYDPEWIDYAPSVLYVDMENGPDDLEERRGALRAAEGMDEEQFIHQWMPDLPGLDTAAGARALTDMLDGWNIADGDLLVVDSLQRLTEGPEDKGDTMRAYYRHTAAMLRRRGITVLRTDNTGKDESRGARGSRAKQDDVDIEWSLRRTSSGLTLRPTKNRTGVAPLAVEADMGTLPDGRPVVTGYRCAQAKTDVTIIEREPRESLLIALADDVSAPRSGSGLTAHLGWGKGRAARERTQGLLDTLAAEGLAENRGEGKHPRWYVTAAGKDAAAEVRERDEVEA